MFIPKAVLRAAIDFLSFPFLLLRSRNSLAAQNLLLRKQLALNREGRIKPRRIESASK